jgi:hypothetical protein
MKRCPHCDQHTRIAELEATVETFREEADRALRLERSLEASDRRIGELERENAALRAFTADDTVFAFIRDQARVQADDLVEHVRAIILAERPDLAGLLELLDRKLAERRAARDKERS